MDIEKKLEIKNSSRKINIKWKKKKIPYGWTGGLESNSSSFVWKYDERLY